MPRIALLVAPFLALTTAHADVVDSSSNGFTSKTTVVVAKPPAAAWKSLVAFGRWWDPAHSYSGTSANLSLVAKPGGCLCEKLPGGGVEHARVTYADPGKLLRLRGALGPLGAMGVSAVMTFELVEGKDADKGKTTITLTYAVGGYAPTGLDKLAKPVDGVLAHQLARLAALK
jgi:uncharacterized protein YndB with AHSA1/START domain